MIDDAFQSRRDPIVVPGANMEFAMQLIMTSLLQDLVGEARKPPTPALSRASRRRG
jgi:phosphoribulokinase